MKNNLLSILLVLWCLPSVSAERTSQELCKRAITAYQRDDFEQALTLFTAALRSDMQQVKVLYNCAFVLSAMGNHALGLRFYNQVLQREPLHENALYGRAKCYLALGDFERGWLEFEHRFDNPEHYKNLFGHHRVNLADCAGKKICIRTEFGFGDAFQMMRYARALYELGATVYAQLPAPLHPLFSRCSYLAGVVDEHFVPKGIDYHIPLMSLPMVFKTTLHSIPVYQEYLQADPQLVQKWRARLPQNTFKIGICWKGKPGYLTERSKYTSRPVPLKTFSALATCGDLQLISLQQIDGINELSELADSLPLMTFDETFDNAHGRFMDTAAVIKNLDLIISTDTSLVHLAGALGAKVWVLLPYAAEWRWLQKRTDSPWYKNMRLFRQQTPGDWEAVMQQVCGELKKLLHEWEPA